MFKPTHEEKIALSVIAICLGGAIALFVSGCEGSAVYRVRFNPPRELEPLPGKPPNIPLINRGFSGSAGQTWSSPHQGGR